MTEERNERQARGNWHRRLRREKNVKKGSDISGGRTGTSQGKHIKTPGNSDG